MRDLFGRLKCLFGFHTPMKYVCIEVDGRRFKVCLYCGKCLAQAEDGE